MITNEVIDNFLECKHKGYLKFNNEIGSKTEYELLEYELLNLYKKNFYDDLQTNSKIQILQAFELLKKSPIKDLSYILEPLVQAKQFKISFDALEISPQKSSLTTLSYLPILVFPKERILKKDKISFCIKCLILSRLQRITFEYGKIIYGRNLTTAKINLNTFTKDAQKSLNKLVKTIENEEAPSFYQDSHCEICEFKELCRTKLLVRDDLSLLGRISEKEVTKNNNKGIFTIYQLSHTFRHRKKRKNISKKSQRILWELKALALRENKTYIQLVPQLPHSETEIYLDFEGLPENNFIYLIGLIIKEGNEQKQFSFWADSKNHEESIFEQFFETLSNVSGFMIYHYGNYEIQVLKKINKKYNNAYRNIIMMIIRKSFNILSLFTSSVYPPTYTNELKDIACLLGFKWSEKNASSIQSIVWRKKWELFNNDEYKRKLIQYNIEDCLALMLVKKWISSIEQNLKQAESRDFAKVEDLEDESFLKWGTTDYQLPDFDKINKYSYFDYQREKIYLRTSERVKSAVKRCSKNRKLANKVNAIIEVPFIQNCTFCNFESLQYYRRKQIVIDLKFMKSGIKKWITEHRGGTFQCRRCKRSNTPKKLVEVFPYGHNLIAWAVNQHIAYRVSFKKIANILLESFNIKIPSPVNMYKFKGIIANEYKTTYQEIKHNIISGSLIHTDETHVEVKGFSTGYVWVLTNLDSVFYLFKPTRETDFLKEMLIDFEGVLVSDFYSGYDSMPCRQQKCLVHLIRDLNNDLLNNQLDIEFKEIVYEFGKLLKKIVDTVDKYGLKKRHLNKHKRDVEKYYKRIINKEYESEIAINYQKRFLKNEAKLFTFLNYDGIPWNNNNAEHAIKPFAKYRREVRGIFSEKTIQKYLVLLSIQQTCKYRNISFLDFLKSKEKSIEKYTK